MVKYQKYINKIKFQLFFIIKFNLSKFTIGSFIYHPLNLSGSCVNETLFISKMAVLKR